MASIADQAKQLGVNLQTGLSKVEATSRLKQAKKEVSSKDIAHTARVKRDGAYSSSVPVEQIVAGDVIWLSAGDICGVEARLFDGTNIVKGLKASLSTPSVFAPGDKVESGCGEALVLQPYKIAVLRAKAEHLLSAQPTSPGELKSKSTSELHGAITKADPALRKSGNLPAVAPKQDKHNIAVLDAKRAAAMSRITCMIMGIRGIITVDKTEVESVYVDGRLLGRSDPLLKTKASSAGSACELLLKAATLCHTAKLDPALADLNDSVLPSGVITRAAAMRLLMHLGQSASNIVSSLPTVAVQDVSSSKLSFSMHKSGAGHIVFMRGVFANVRLRCTSMAISTDAGGVQHEKGEDVWKDVGKQAKTLSGECEDVCAYAMKSVPGGDGKLTDEILSAKDFAFLGIVAASDPLREFAPEALGSLQNLKMRVMLATAESATYARIIAKKASFLTEDTVEDIAEKHNLMPGEVDPRSAQAMVSASGALLSELHGNEFDDALLKRQLIFAGVTSKQRLYLVEAMKQRGDLLGVVLESSQDVAAGQRSEVTFAYACSTDVCKEAAAVISLTDSIASLVYALNEVRGSPASGGTLSADKSARDKEACVVQ